MCIEIYIALGLISSLLIIVIGAMLLIIEKEDNSRSGNVDISPQARLNSLYTDDNYYNIFFS